MKKHTRQALNRSTKVIEPDEVESQSLCRTCPFDKDLLNVAGELRAGFGAQAAMDEHWGTIGLQRANVKMSLMNLVYNRKRLIQLIKRNANAVK